MIKNREIKKRMEINSSFLAPYACKNEDAFRLHLENDDDIRPAFYRDTDRIIYSLSYTRYIDKTQVFTFEENDNISKRMTHVQMVSKIARTIGRALKLNEDLIEAAALGHDLGHPPFGHVGESILNELSIKHNEGFFHHNVQSFRTLVFLEKNGLGKNICIQTLDAILCHNGEFVSQKYEPQQKTSDEVLKEYQNCFKIPNYPRTLRAMTLEGCVVRISDLIAYLGRDFEDAIRLGILKETDLPKSIGDVLGYKNSEIIDTLVHDVIQNSYDKPYVKISEKVYQAIKEFKKFNYDHIYVQANSQAELKGYEKMFNELFDKYLSEIESNNTKAEIYQVFLNNMSNDYQKNNSSVRKVLDYIAGMTDDYFFNQYYQHTIPSKKNKKTYNKLRGE